MERQRSLVHNPKMQVLLVILAGLALYAWLTIRQGGPANNRVAILIDAFLFYFWMVFWHFFFSQFVLPVQKLSDRWLIFKRLWSYLIGRHGPAFLVENGQIRQRKRKFEDHKPGIALVDAASAIMLRTDSTYTRPAGPGVVFTKATTWPHTEHEYLAGIVDLRLQNQVLGPKENEDPFLPRGEAEKEAVYIERQKRRYQTSGLTRNGIEVVPNIMVTFRLNARPGQDGTPFGYDGSSVRLAITGEGIDPDLPADDARRNISWQDLPAYLAANIWREALSLLTLDELFQELPPDYHLTSTSTDDQSTSSLPEIRFIGLEFISNWLKQRLTVEVIDELGYTGRPTGGRILSQEFKILKERGIRATNVYITNLHFPAAVDEELARRWNSTWYQHALADRQEIEKQLSDAQTHGQQVARLEYAMAIAQRLKKLSPGIEHSNEEVLSEMVEGSLQWVIRHPYLRKNAANERDALLEIIAGLQNNPSIL
jgi:hypothetical protein